VVILVFKEASSSVEALLIKSAIIGVAIANAKTKAPTKKSS